MKKSEDISMTELEAIARDGSIRVPEGLKEDIRSGLDTLEFLSGSETRSPRWIRYTAAAAASLAILAGIGLGLDSRSRQPKDTFSDPEQAYAMLAASLSLISSKVDEGMVSATHGTESVFNITSDIMGKIK